MNFDRFTVSLLTLRADAPVLDEAALDALQDEHMAHLADLHDEGLLLAAGPLPGEEDRHFRGLSIWAPEVDTVRELLAEHPDPAVAAGRFEVTVMPWLVPSGAVHFTRTRLPRSMLEVRAGDS
jgi:uncharacterized protein YciI